MEISKELRIITNMLNDVAKGMDQDNMEASKKIIKDAVSDLRNVIDNYNILKEKIKDLQISD